MTDIAKTSSPVTGVADASVDSHLQALYRNRFSDSERARKDEIWRVLCARFFQRYVRPTDTVLDIASGLGEFSRHIKAARIFAVDLNPDAANFLPDGSAFSLTSAERMDFLSDNSVDVAFTSNFLEHLPTKIVLDAVLREVWRVLRPGGILIALQPNIRYAYKEYWDFYDHHTPLSHLSCAEAFEIAGLHVIELIDRFLPFSTKSVLPTHPLLVRIYLVCRPAWRFFGKQFLIVGQKGGIQKSPNRSNPPRARAGKRGGIDPSGTDRYRGS
jgi:SAM-dependent methyltransferase